MRGAVVVSLVLAGLVVGAAPAAAKIKLKKPPRGFQMRITPFEIPAGGEREVCEFRTLSNKKPMDVQGFDLNMTAGGHHFVLWEYLGTHTNPAEFPTDLEDRPGCVGFGPPDSFGTQANLFGMQTSRARVRFPAGVAVRLEPNAFVYLNTHLRNPSPTEPLMAEAVFNVRPARKGTVKHHAQAFVVGNLLGIRIPALGTQTLVTDWHTPVALNLVQVSTHQHKRGTRALVEHLDAAGNSKGVLFEGANWEHPGEKWYASAFRVEAGEGLRVTCAWSNPDDRTVRFGVTTDDEMCFGTGYFYPDDESLPVTGPGCLPQGQGLLCFGQTVSSVTTP